MDQMQQNTAGTPTGLPQEEKSMGALIGSIIVIAVIVLGGIYFWVTRSGESTTPTEAPTLGQAVKPDEATAALLVQGTSTEISDIEKDLNATNLNDIDAGMNDISSQL